jgi:hypothetical protein
MYEGTGGLNQLGSGLEYNDTARIRRRSGDEL